MSTEPWIDAPLPPEMAARAEAAGIAKATLPVDRLALLSVLGGAFISLGAVFSTVVTSGGGVPFGVSRLLGGLSFSLGLVLVVGAGAELFTGNTLIVMAFASRCIRLRQMMRNWVLVYVGNFVGALATAVVVVGSEEYRQGNGVIGQRMLEIAAAKSSLGFGRAVLLGVVANALVCLAVWLSLAARTLTDKVVAVILPVTAFVAGGFEHSIANMYFVPAGLLVKAWAPDSFFVSTGTDPSSYGGLTWGHFLVHNLVPVTLGNIVGGAGLVGLVYWLAYRRPRSSGTGR